MFRTWCRRLLGLPTGPRHPITREPRRSRPRLGLEGLEGRDVPRS